MREKGRRMEGAIKELRGRSMSYEGARREGRMKL